MSNNEYTINDLLDRVHLICETSRATTAALGLECTIEELTATTMRSAIFGLGMQFELIDELLRKIPYIKKDITLKS